MLNTVLAVVAIGGVVAVVYSYALYPVVLFLIGAINQGLRDVAFVFRKRDRRIEAGREATDEPAEWPAVAVVISAYNEEAHIVSRIENLLALDYPADKLRAYIGSDGSRDRTAELMARFADEPRIVALPFEVNRGKASVLNDLVSRTSEPIVAFSDANTYFERSALKRLVARFADPKVGGVTGELRLLGNNGDNQDSLYWRIEQFLKFFEARIGALLGANGAIYAIRRELWQPLRPDTICDDFCVAMNVSAAGHRLVYEPKAWAEEDTPEAIGEEVKRRIRIGIGNFQALARHPQYLTRTSAATAFAYVSHKVLRWTAPHLLLLALGASAALAMLQPGAGWGTYAVAQAVSYVLAWFGWRLTTRGVKLPTVVKLAAFLFALNWAFLVASWRYTTGQATGSWGRTAR